jgi:hypothetical protein
MMHLLLYVAVGSDTKQYFLYDPIVHERLILLSHFQTLRVYKSSYGIVSLQDDDDMLHRRPLFILAMPFSSLVCLFRTFSVCWIVHAWP